MAETISFRGAVLRRFECPPAGETTPFVRSHWTVDFAEPSNEAMGWKDPGDCGVTGADLVGDIAAANVVVTPHDPQLQKYELQFDCHEASDFKLHTVKDPDSSRREVRFIIRSNQQGVAALLENYRWIVGDKEASLRLSYIKQETLDLGDAPPLSQENPIAEQLANLARAEHGPIADDELVAEFGTEDGPCPSCCNRIPYEDAAKTTHVTGQKCLRVDSGTLASSSRMGIVKPKERKMRKPLDIPSEDDAAADVAEVVQ